MEGRNFGRTEYGKEGMLGGKTHSCYVSGCHVVGRTVLSVGRTLMEGRTEEGYYRKEGRTESRQEGTRDIQEERERKEAEGKERALKTKGRKEG